MFRATEFLQQSDATLPPRGIRWQSQSLEDDLVHLVDEQELGQRELLLRRERPHRVVTDGQEHAAWHRLLVVLDLSFEVELVLVLERSGGALRHARSGGRRAVR